MYVVAADVSRAFDGVDIDRLLRIAEPLLRAPEYVLVKHVEVGSGPVSHSTTHCSMLAHSGAYI